MPGKACSWHMRCWQPAKSTRRTAGPWPTSQQLPSTTWGSTSLPGNGCGTFWRCTPHTTVVSNTNTHHRCSTWGSIICLFCAGIAAPAAGPEPAGHGGGEHREGWRHRNRGRHSAGSSWRHCGSTPCSEMTATCDEMLTAVLSCHDLASGGAAETDGVLLKF